MGKLSDSPAGSTWAYTCGFSQQGLAQPGGEVLDGLIHTLDNWCWSAVGAPQFRPGLGSITWATYYWPKQPQSKHRIKGWSNGLHLHPSPPNLGERSPQNLWFSFSIFNGNQFPLQLE